MEWQPIDTAPKDGTVVLLCDEHGNRWTDCSPGCLENGCGLPAAWWMELPPPPVPVSTGWDSQSCFRVGG